MSTRAVVERPLQADVREQARKFFEPQLAALGLGEDQIKKQTLRELELSLEQLNDAIAHPESFGVLSLTAQASVLLSRTESEFQIGALPILLERKGLILERISILKGDEKVESLKELIRQEADQSVRTKLEKQLDDLQSDVIKWREKAKEIEHAQDQAEREQQIQFAKVEVFERRSRIWQSFLERESVATIIGGVLLVLITLFLIISAFVQASVSEILSNAFLVILGYFFGQSVNKVTTRVQGTNSPPS